MQQTDLTSTAIPDFVNILSQAAAAYRGEGGVRPTVEVVVNALLQAEKATKQQRLNYSYESLLGE